jgi:uncharacterized protein (DUF779 family)
VIPQRQKSKPCKGPCSGEDRFDDNDLFSGPIVKHHCPVRCNPTRGSKVCATNGETYANECTIMQLQCAGQDVFFEHFGGCCDAETGNCDDYQGEALVNTNGMEMDVGMGVEFEGKKLFLPNLHFSRIKLFHSIYLFLFNYFPPILYYILRTNYVIPCNIYGPC